MSRMTSARTPRGALLAALLLACGGDHAPPPGSGAQRMPDSDGGSGTNGTDRQDAGSPRPPGPAILPPADDEIVLPFGGPPVTYDMEVEAKPGVLDVHLSIDTTSSISDEIDALQRDLNERVIKRLRARVADVSFGVSRFEDFPILPFGSPGSSNRRERADEPFQLLTPITSDTARVNSAVAKLDDPLGYGGDIPESGAEALWQIATGAGYRRGDTVVIEAFSGRAAPGGGTAGGVGFREGALRVVLHVTDAGSHTPQNYEPLFPGTHSVAEAGAALAAINAKLLGVVSDACACETCGCDRLRYVRARSELEQLALATGAIAEPDRDDLCPYGISGLPLPSVGGTCPLVFDVTDKGLGLSDTLVDAIVRLLDGVRFGRVSGLPGDDPLGFVVAVRPKPPRRSSEAKAEIADLLPESAPDGEPDSFLMARSGARLEFEVELANRRIAPLDVEQRFRVVVQIIGDGLILRERTLRIRIPAGGGLLPPVPDAAVPDAQAADDDAGP